MTAVTNSAINTVYFCLGVVFFISIVHLLASIMIYQATEKSLSQKNRDQKFFLPIAPA
jgi:hypothetical protein